MIKPLAAIIAAAISLPLISPALAEEDIAELRWEPPRTRENGEPFDPATELQEFRLYCTGEQVATIPRLSGGRKSLSKSEMFGDSYGIHECALTAVDTGGLESDFSNIIKIPYPAINVAVPPQSIAVEEGQPATFSVTATGTGLTYQWRKDGEEIQGATDSTFTIESVTAEDAGSYNVRITDSNGENKWTAFGKLEVKSVEAAPVAPSEFIYIEP